MKSIKKTGILIALLLILALAVSACSNLDDDHNSPKESNETHWMNINLTDVRTGEIYKISDFKGKKVLMETFAVWCVNCKDQQDEIKKFHDEFGNDTISISLNSDPNENIQEVKAHVQRNNYTWHYSIASKKFIKNLMDEFGFVIINAPQAPIVLICEDGSYSLLPSGLKTAEDLKEEIREGC